MFPGKLVPVSPGLLWAVLPLRPSPRWPVFLIEIPTSSRDPRTPATRVQGERTRWAQPAPPPFLASLPDWALPSCRPSSTCPVTLIDQSPCSWAPAARHSHLPIPGQPRLTFCLVPSPRIGLSQLEGFRRQLLDVLQRSTKPKVSSSPLSRLGSQVSSLPDLLLATYPSAQSTRGPHCGRPDWGVIGVSGTSGS